ncbi:MAG TPA: carbohydrate porin [Candidatus Binatia bacterium]
MALASASRAEDPAAWLAGPDATGDWGGERTKLDEHGVHFDVTYTSEVFTRDFEAVKYRGDADLMLTVDTAKAGMWKGGTLFGYAQDDRGDGVSPHLGLVMPVSNYEAPAFTQLSELWIYQQLPAGFALRLGKQDANRDFASPRFGGNFLNSSFGVLPTAPMPSFPAPALGASLFAQPASWLSLRGGVYDGSSRSESFAGSAFNHGGGVFAIGAARLEQGLDGPRDIVWQVGGWHLSGDNRSGGFAVGDLFVHMPVTDAHPDPRTFQFFVRTNFEPDAKSGPDGKVAKVYVGGGATAHGFFGKNNTVGLGSGYVSVEGADETFLELFFKWRPLAWFTIEPDAQLYFDGNDTHVVIGLRTKLKL